MIPIFYHIPKSAGTYYNFKMQKALKEIYPDSGMIGIRKTIELRQGEKQPTVVANVILKSVKGLPRNIPYMYFAQDFNRLDILSFTMEAHSFTKNHMQQILSLFEGTETWDVGLLRKPYDRIQSLYNYITSHHSKHEWSHGYIKDKTWPDYINGKFFNASWLMTATTGIANKDWQNFTDKHCLQTYSKLKHVDWFKHNKVDTLIDKVLKKCYNHKIQNTDISDIPANTSSIAKIPFEDLDKDTQETFLNKTFWDRKLYRSLLEKDVNA